MRRSVRRATRMLLASAAAALAACNPCENPVGCVQRAHLTISGRLLHESTGAPAAGYLVDFVRSSGVALDVDSSRGAADREGLFTIRVNADATGLVTGDFVVRPAPGMEGAPYRVPAQTLRALSDIGDANVLPVWSTRPTLPDIAMLTGAGIPPGELAGIQVEFRRTGGVHILEGNVFRTTVRSDGVFPLFDRQVQPANAGEVIGDLYVGVNNLVLRGLRITATPEFRRNPLLYIIDATP